MSLYPFVARHIYKTPSDPKWKFSRVRLFTGLIDAAIAMESDTLYGAYFGPQTKHAVLDIDEDSRYHNDEQLQRLREVLATVELFFVRYQSSNGGGWHLYLFFEDWQDSNEVAHSLKAFLKANKFDIEQGELEIFPSQTQALRLPLQRGFAWLDRQIAREQLKTEQALDLFLEDWRRTASNWTSAKRLIDAHLQSTAPAAGVVPPAHMEAIANQGFDELFRSRLIQENYDKGRKYWHEGLTGKNQRHEAIICIEHYLWHGDTAEGLPAYPGRFNDKARFRLIRQWLEQNHNGHCRHIAAGNWNEVEGDIKRAVAWRRDDQAQNQKTPYSLLKSELAQERMIALAQSTGRAWTLEDWQKGNERRERTARRKIRKAMVAMLAGGEQLTRNGLADKSGCSPNTVSKHRDIWALFASGSSDKSGGVQGGLSGFSGSFEEKKEFLDRSSPAILPSCAGSLQGLEESFRHNHPAGCQFDASTGSQKGISGEKGGLRIFSGSPGSCSEELAPVVITPPFLLPGLEPTSEPPASRPSPSGSFGSLDAGAPVRWYSGRTADGAGGLEPSCNQAAEGSEIINSRRGNGDAPMVTSPANLLQAHIGVNLAQVRQVDDGIINWPARVTGTTGYPTAITLNDVSASNPQAALSGLFLHQPYTGGKSCKHPVGTSFRWIHRSGTYTSFGGCIRVNSPQDKPLQVLVYSDVRGPPSVNSALIATSAL